MVFGSILRNPVKLSLTIDKPSAMPGESLTYRVRVDASKDAEIKSLSAGLDGVMRGRTTCWYRDSEDERTYSRDTDYTISLFGEEHVLIENTRVRKGSYVYTGSFDIPLDAPHSGRRGEFEVVWYLWAKARTGFRTSEAETRVEIVSSGVHGPITGKAVRLGDAEAAVLMPEYLRAGTAAEGILQLRTGEGTGYRCREVIAEIVNSVRIDKYTIDHNAEDCDYINYTKTVAKQKISGDLALAPQTKHEIRFRVSIPEDAVPSFNTGVSYSRWALKITCSKGLMKKDELTIPIKVV